MLNPAPGSRPNPMMGTLFQGVRTSQDILVHVLRANAQVLATTKELLEKIAETLESNRVEPASPPASTPPEKVKVTKAVKVKVKGS
ncbi:MAG: hypothetical protein M3P29_04065 [Acidobacteriota bacterium]|nr:hypothetical protein [Acidobacteriota bacterium]